MSTFLRLLNESDKASSLIATCTKLRQGETDPRCFEVASESFDSIPGKPFAYWVSDAVRSLFYKLPSFESEERITKQGLASADDFRFVRLWWESESIGWYGFAKGGAFSPFYADVYLLVNWAVDGGEIKNNLNDSGAVRSNVWMLSDTAVNFFLRPGLTWPRRTTSGISIRAMPEGCIFGDKGPAVFVIDNSPDELLMLLAITNSRPFSILVELQLAAADAAARSYEVGVVQRTPIPPMSAMQRQQLAKLARQAWSLKRTLDSVNETSHAFVLPAVLHAPIKLVRSFTIKMEIDEIQSAIDAIAYDLYGFAEEDRRVVNGPVIQKDAAEMDEDDEEIDIEVPSTDGILAWAVGVAFGRFDLRIATGERPIPPEPEPFDPLSKKAPGMLLEGAQPFHAHEGVLTDEQGHPHDLVYLVEEVLGQVNAPVPDDLRRWLRKEFFAFHLKLYSKSRRKAPIYWPLSTASSSYTLWVYYPSLTSQTLYTAINDFLDGPNGKLTQVSQQVSELRNRAAARTRDDEKQFESLQTFELELIELRDTLLKLAHTYKPNHDDGVQISAAPLWSLFRHKPWQKVLKDTWAKLEKGDYDWADLAMNYWPERVREKCKTDKSLAIAHGLENLYVEPETKPKTARGKKKSGDAL